MAAFLRALGLRNYRGVGPEWAMMSDFRDFNFFIGANNTGKSTVLNFISKWIPLSERALSPHRTDNGRGPVLDPTEIYMRGVNGQPEAAQGVEAKTVLENLVEKLPERNRVHLASLAHKLVDTIAEDGFVWRQYAIPNTDRSPLLHADIIKRDLFSRDDWQTLWGALTERSGGGLDDHWRPQTIAELSRATTQTLPKTLLIPAIRQIGPKGHAFEEFGGQGLIDRLAEMQSPDIDKRHERDHFDQINRFLKAVTGYGEAHIEIPHNRAHILVHIDGKVLPLWALGTGIHEVVLIASYCTINQDIIACIEEPELHLHPLLQRKLLAYLKQNTTNQYFIATHSAAFIDTPDAAIFHVRAEDGQTRIEKAVLRSGRVGICRDLGYKASDIVQSNAVIWCEGPSDRIYLNHWIASVAPDLVEGTHYSVMFYGGRNLSHLSAEDDEINEFISLRALNQNCAILIDSDRSKPGDAINATKTRLCAEFSSGDGMAWVTDGREIENYVEFSQLQTAVQAVHSKGYDRASSAGGAFDRTLSYMANKADGTQAEVTADKVKVAKVIAGQPANLDVLDLKARVVELVAMIRKANG